jgi:hypothetical protein
MTSLKDKDSQLPEITVMTGKKATRSPYLFGSGTITAMFHTQENQSSL